MVIFVIVMVAIALLAAVGFLISNRSGTQSPAANVKLPVQPIQPVTKPVAKPVPQPQPQPQPQQMTTTNEDIVTYIPAEIPAILQDVLSSLPLATTEEAMMGCYGTMGAGAQNPAGKPQVHPFQTNSLDELLVRATEAVNSMETEQHISKFTISTHKKSKANPHVDLFVHSTEPKRIRLIRFWRTQDTFIANLPQ